MCETAEKYRRDVINFDLIKMLNGVTSIEERSAPRIDGYAWYVHLSNGRAISVIHGRRANCGNDTVEIAMLNAEGDVDYSTPITDDTLGWVTPDELGIYVRWAISL